MAKPGRTGPPSNTRSPVQAHTGEAALELHDTRRRRAGAASRCVQAVAISATAWRRLALGELKCGRMPRMYADVCGGCRRTYGGRMLKQVHVFGSGKRWALLARSRLKRQSSMSRRRTRRAREGGSVGRRTPDASAAAHGSADSPPSWFLLKPRPRFPPAPRERGADRGAWPSGQPAASHIQRRNGQGKASSRRQQQ